MDQFKVLIIGAGLGGLTLAQSLRRADIDVDVFERDASPWERPQGYRLHLDADALCAAREVLPPALHGVFEATSQRTAPFTTLLKTDLTVLRRLPTHDDFGEAVWPSADPDHHCNVDRATLRQLLLAGLDGRMHFEQRLTRYESRPDGVIAHFPDGSSVRGDVLVGADGIRSAVRTQRAPHARTVEAGVRAIYGRIPLKAARACVPGETLRDIFTIASDARKAFLGLGSVCFPVAPEQAATAVPGLTLRPQTDYLACIVGARREIFNGLSASTRGAPGPELQQAALEVLSAWPTPARAPLLAADPAAFFLVDMYTSVPCELDRPGRVTLLGDAIHAMTPTLGRGANLAMRDGALLGRALTAVARGRWPLAEALASFEQGMLRYGFDVVREAATIGAQRMTQNPLPER